MFPYEGRHLYLVVVLVRPVLAVQEHKHQKHPVYTNTLVNKEHPVYINTLVNKEQPVYTNTLVNKEHPVYTNVS